MKNPHLRYFIALWSLVFFAFIGNAEWVQTNGPYGGKVNVFAVCDGKIYAGTEYGGIFLSTNSGASWTAINNGITDKRIMSLAASGSTVVAGTVYSVYLSTNNGTTWTEISSNKLHEPNVVNIDASSVAIYGSTIILSVWQGIFRTTDNGANWTQVSSLRGGKKSLAVNDSTVFFAAPTNSIYRSIDNGTSWTATDPGLGLPVTSLVVNGKNVYAGSAVNGVSISTDNGTSWTTVNSGINDTHVQAIAVNGGNLYAGTKLGVSLSSNNGANWTGLNPILLDTNILYFVNSLAVVGSTILVGNGLGIYRSTDNGTLWNKADSGLTATCINSLAKDGGNLIAVANEGVFLSTNNGTNWTELNSHFKYTGAQSVTVTSDNAIWIGTQKFGTSRSTDNGRNWIDQRTGIPFCIAEIGNSIFEGTGTGAYRSTNNGASWQQINSGFQELPQNMVDVYSFLGAQSFVLAGVSGLTAGVYRSIDNGTSWTITNGIGVCRAFISTGDAILAGTSYSGLLRSTDGSGWMKVDPGLTDRQIWSFAANGENILAGTEGYFTRSIDNGDTIWFGTKGGVVLSTNNGINWSEISDGLTETNVRSLLIGSDSTIYAGIYGGGVWRRPLSEMTGVTNTLPQRKTLQQTNFKIHAPIHTDPYFSIELFLSHADNVAIQIFDLSGKKLGSIVNKRLASGLFRYRWNAQSVSHGAYIVRVQIGLNTFVKSILMFR